MFGEISINDVIGYRFDGMGKDGSRIYMPITWGFKALKGAQTHVERFASALANVIRRSFDSLERIAEANKEGLLTGLEPMYSLFLERLLNSILMPLIRKN